MPSVWLESRKARGSRVWIARWETVRDGVRSRGSKACGPFKAYAEKIRARKLEELFGGHLGVDPLVSDVSWGDFAKTYLEHCRKHKAQGTFQNFDKRAVDQFGQFMSGKSLSKISGEDIGRWETDLLKEFKPNTVRMRLRSIRAAMNWAKAERMLAVVPRFHMPKAEKVGRVLSNIEVKLLLDQLPKDPREAVIFALHTGLRRGELLSLAWDRVRRTTEGYLEAEIGGIGGPTTKTRESRIVPIHADAVGAMGFPKRSGLVFPKVGVNISHSVEDAARRAGLGRVRFHDLRHTWATRFMQTTGDLFALMQVGGWKDMGSVREYQHQTKSRALAIGSISYEIPPNLPT